MSTPKHNCPICSVDLKPNPRYPNYICRTCASSDITDTEGTKVSFSNIGMTGGLSVSFYKDGAIVSSDDSHQTFTCFINGHRCIAQEARFGGIVIQLKI